MAIINFNFQIVMKSHFYSDNLPILFKPSRKFLSRIYKKFNSYLCPPKKHFLFSSDIMVEIKVRNNNNKKKINLAYILDQLVTLFPETLTE